MAIEVYPRPGRCGEVVRLQSSATITAAVSLSLSSSFLYPSVRFNHYTPPNSLKPSCSRPQLLQEQDEWNSFHVASHAAARLTFRVRTRFPGPPEGHITRSRLPLGAFLRHFNVASHRGRALRTAWAYGAHTDCRSLGWVSCVPETSRLSLRTDGRRVNAGKFGDLSPRCLQCLRCFWHKQG